MADDMTDAERPRNEIAQDAAATRAGEALSALAAALAPRYRVERAIGSGGMATVYLARDLKHERDVAIKVFKADVAAVIGADRFLDEIKTTAHLKHPHILPLFDSGSAGNALGPCPPPAALRGCSSASTIRRGAR